MRSLLTVSFLLALVVPASAQTTWYVDVNSPPPGSGTEDDPYASIQYAIAQPTTIPGDTLLVLPGIYAENLDLHGKVLTLESLQGPGATIVDGGGIAPAVRLDNSDQPGTRIEGFTIQNGYGVIHGDQLVYGGGMHCVTAHVEIVGCVIRANYAAFGGGVYLENAQASFTNCSLSENLCGSALLARSATVTLEGSSISGNTEWSCHGDYAIGGIIVEQSGLTITNCNIERNRGWGGSGIAAENSATTIVHSTIARNGNYPNAIGYRGGIYARNGVLSVVDTLFEDNWNEYRGGAIAIYGAEVHVQGCTFSSNISTDHYWGGGIYVDDDALGTILYVLDSHFQDGYSGGGSGIWIGSGVAELTNTTFSDNDAYTYYYEEGSGGAIWVNDGASATITACSFEDNVAGGDSTFGGKGGAIYVRPNASALIRRCVFLQNHSEPVGNLFAHDPGRGAAVYGPAYIENCSIVENVAEDDEELAGEGGGAFGASLNSCILWSNAPDSLAGNASAAWCDVAGGWSGEGNFDADPGFWGASNGDLHLLPGSPCIDTGDPARFDEDGSRVDVGTIPFDPAYCGTPETFCEAKENSLGCLPAIGWSGSLSISGEDNFHVLASNIVPSKIGVLLWGSSGASTLPFFGGTLCVATPLQRSPRLFSAGYGDEACLGAFDFHFSQAYMKAHEVVVGTRLYLQFWYRDPHHADGTGVGLTDALAATVCASQTN